MIEVFTLVKDVELGEDTDYVSLLFDAEDGEDSIIVAALKKLSGLELGGVRAPLLNLANGDEAVVEKTVALVEAAVANWIK